jgi:hypothetical protein
MEFQGTTTFRRIRLWILRIASWIKALTITKFLAYFAYLEQIGLCYHLTVFPLTLLGNGSVTRSGGNEHTQQ